MKDFKVVFLGQVNVGKSSIAHCLREGQASTTEHGPTIAAGYVGLEKDGIKLCMWDSSGSERFSAILPMYVRGARIIVLVYDVSDPSSIEKVKANRFRFVEEQPETLEATWIVVGNKCDLRSTASWWSDEMVEFARANQMKHVQVSAHSGTNLDVLLEEMLSAAHKQEVPVGDPAIVQLDHPTVSTHSTPATWFREMSDKFGGCFK